MHAATRVATRRARIAAAGGADRRSANIAAAAGDAVGGADPRRAGGRARPTRPLSSPPMGSPTRYLPVLPGVLTTFARKVCSRAGLLGSERSFDHR